MRVFLFCFFCCQYYCNLCNRGNISWNLLYIFVTRHTQKSAPLDAFFKKKKKKKKKDELLSCQLEKQSVMMQPFKSKRYLITLL